MAAALVLPFMAATAQVQSDSNLGIHFEQTLHWDQILAKAKAEHKYIFVDCYTTWCAPCKYMDVNVYPLKEVGDAYSQFICVRVQMDKTKPDDQHTVYWYGMANYFAQNYRVNAYPTFLFFGPDGKPLHKATGSLDVKGFIQLAMDAQNPDKQYYSILNNFQPGKLDTAEEKGLARGFHDSDKQLAGAIAADYLTRIPQEDLNKIDNGIFMVEFSDDPRVLNIVLDFIHSKPLKDNLKFMVDLKERPQVKTIAINYINSLGKNEISEEKNLDFMTSFSEDTEVKKIANIYINSVPEVDLYNSKKKIDFLNAFTDTTTDRGFGIFYHHTKTINKIMGDNYYAPSAVDRLIYNEDCKTEYTKSTITLTEPDFSAIFSKIDRKYDTYYAKRETLGAKLAWYKFIVLKKNQSQYWPQLIQARTDIWDELRIDTMAIDFNGRSINNVAFSYYYKHCDDPKQLNKAIYWMEELIGRKSRDEGYTDGYVDTYACLLYKAGKKDEALKQEETILQIYKNQKDQKDADYTSSVIAAMKNGEKIWLEKQFQ